MFHCHCLVVEVVLSRAIVQVVGTSSMLVVEWLWLWLCHGHGGHCRHGPGGSRCIVDAGGHRHCCHVAVALAIGVPSLSSSSSWVGHAVVVTSCIVAIAIVMHMLLVLVVVVAIIMQGLV